MFRYSFLGGEVSFCLYTIGLILGDSREDCCEALHLRPRLTLRRKPFTIFLKLFTSPFGGLLEVLIQAALFLIAVLKSSILRLSVSLQRDDIRNSSLDRSMPRRRSCLVLLRGRPLLVSGVRSKSSRSSYSSSASP